ncbi:MAG: redoxin domain-containing protein [Chloroflexi bacterium]|nr:redoxin domain-containing protein [Chloroflexota bacterium]
MSFLKKGEKAPNFELTAHDSTRVNLYDVLASGRRVILTFHPASFTGG